MKFFKYTLYLLLVLFVAGFITIKVMSGPKPSAEADALATEILSVINKSAFDTLPYLRWEFFREGQKYFWDKKNNKAIIEFADYKVLYNLNTMNAQCYKNRQMLDGDAHEAAKQKAWSNWCNDSFWMIAPFKLFDIGTTRKVVTIDNKRHLMVEYSSGGVTPGDSYLWILDENQRPYGWKMWRSILSIKGIYNAWSGWQTFEGIQFSTTHDFFGKEVTMKNVLAAKTLKEFGYDEDPLKNI